MAVVDVSLVVVRVNVVVVVLTVVDVVVVVVVHSESAMKCCHPPFEASTDSARSTELPRRQICLLSR